MSALFPGRSIELEADLVGTVFAVGTKHLRKFQRQITRAVSTISGMKLPDIKDKELLQKWAMVELAPVLINDAFDILTDCIKVAKYVDEKPVDVPLDELPHWYLPPLIVAWVDDSFGEEKKIRPWIEAFQKLQKALPAPQKIG